MKKQNTALLILGSIISPFIIYSIPLYITNGFTGDGGTLTSSLSIGISAIIGIIFILKLPFKIRWKTLLIVVYTPLLGYLLFFYTFWFIGAVFGRWL